MWGVADAITLDGYNRVWIYAGGDEMFPCIISGWGGLLSAPITDLTLRRPGLPAITGERRRIFGKVYYNFVTTLRRHGVMLKLNISKCQIKFNIYRINIELIRY